MVAEVSRPTVPTDNCERLGVNWRSGLITGRQRINELPERLRDRNHDSLCGLSRPEADLVLTEVQVVPGQRRYIRQALIYSILGRLWQSVERVLRSGSNPAGPTIFV